MRTISAESGFNTKTTGYSTWSTPWLEQSKDPRGQRLRSNKFESELWICERCDLGGLRLELHHPVYLRDRHYWDYELHELRALCPDCHKIADEQRKAIQKAQLGVSAKRMGRLLGVAHGLRLSSLPRTMTATETYDVSEWEYLCGFAFGFGVPAADVETAKTLDQTVSGATMWLIRCEYETSETSNLDESR